MYFPHLGSSSSHCFREDMRSCSNDDLEHYSIFNLFIAICLRGIATIPVYPKAISEIP